MENAPPSLSFSLFLFVCLLPAMFCSTGIEPEKVPKVLAWKEREWGN